MPANQPTGQQLLAEFAQYGRQAPFEEIVRRYAGMVYNTCLRVTKNRQDAEDATQAVFLTLALQVKKGTEIKALGPWLQQVAKRLSLDTRRGGKRRKNRETQHHREQICRVEGAEPALPPADLDEVKAVLHEELTKLPSKYRLPLILHYFGGLSREEMAAELNCNPSTLGVRIFRARALLAERLSSRGIDFTPAMLPALLQQMVRCTISHAVMGATTRAAAAVAAGHNAAGLVSARVILLTRRAAAAAVIGKLKMAALGVLITCTLLAAGARAICTVPRLGLSDFIDRQVQSLVRPFLQPFSLPLRVHVLPHRFYGISPMVRNWQRIPAAATQLAAGWRFEPLVPTALAQGDDMLTAVERGTVQATNVFAAAGADAGTVDPAQTLANLEQDTTATLLDPGGDADAATGGGAAGDGAPSLPQSADDASNPAPAGAGSASGTDFSFHLPVPPDAASDPGDSGDDFSGPVSLGRAGLGFGLRAVASSRGTPTSKATDGNRSDGTTGGLASNSAGGSGGFSLRGASGSSDWPHGHMARVRRGAGCGVEPPVTRSHSGSSTFTMPSSTHLPAMEFVPVPDGNLRLPMPANGTGATPPPALMAALATKFGDAGSMTADPMADINRVELRRIFEDAGAGQEWEWGRSEDRFASRSDLGSATTADLALPLEKKSPLPVVGNWASPADEIFAMPAATVDLANPGAALDLSDRSRVTPEPSVLALVGCVGAAALLRRRRNRKPN